MKNKSFKIFMITGIILILLIALGLKNLTFIPGLNNTLVVIEFFLVAFVGLGFGYMIGKIPVENKGTKALKIIVLILFYGALALGLFFYFLFSIFAIKSGEKVDFKGQTYYYIDEGFMDPHYVFYKKTGLTMEKTGKSYVNLPDLTEENLEKLINGTYEEDFGELPEDNVDKSEPLEDKEYQEEKEPTSPEEKEEFLQTLDREDFQRVGNSSYYLAIIDKALGSSYFYYFCKEVDGKMTYISDLFGFPAFVEGQVEEEKIRLTFVDTNGENYSFYSLDGGKNFSKEE